MIRSILIVFTFLILLYSPSWAQESKVWLKPPGTSQTLTDSVLIVKKNINVNDRLRIYINNLINQNYLESSVDSIKKTFVSGEERTTAYIYQGKKYNFETLAFDSSNLKLFKQWKVDPPTNTIEFITLRDKISTYYSNNGYPFAKIYLDSLNLENHKVTGRFNINKGPRIIIDSLCIKGDLKIRTAYLEKYLNIDQGQLYDHSKVIEVGLLLDKLRFLEQEKSPDITFFNQYSTINLYLKNKNTSRFDLLFGVIPTTAIEGQQLFLSLDFTAELLNKLGYGEYLFVNFERLRPEQQEFEFKFNYPYILNLPYAVDFDFSIFRNSFDYQTLKSNIGLEYLVSSDIQIKVGWNVESTKIVDVDTTQVLASQSLPEDLDVEHNGISIESAINKLDYRFNPRKGYSLYVKGVAGKKTIKQNSTILNLSNENVNFSELYEAVKLNSFRYELESEFSLFLPLAQRGAFAFHLKGGWKYSNNKIFRNEKFQIGGNKLLRGFDEATFFTAYYGISTLEYRLLLSNNSYFSVPFIDIGVLENPTAEDEMSESTLAIGFGTSLGVETKAGLFNFSLAVGRTSNEGFDFKRPKAHFGFVSLF
ncbi:MAG: hypothetical protein HKO66_15820 [Saprospiraceae bacterium]|nr:hypothetical protein [Bacteroidia bacterium]NNL93710.1 hypothetical protein [Saprospiraceae bacterium]